MKTTTKRGPGRPKLPESERRVYVSLRLPPRTKEGIKELCRLSNLSMGKLVTQLIDEELNR